jgi:hypothetical protein
VFNIQFLLIFFLTATFFDLFSNTLFLVMQSSNSQRDFTSSSVQIMSPVIILFCMVFLCIIMGRRRTYDPRNYENIDVEAASQDVGAQSPSSDSPTEPPRRRRRRGTHGVSHSPHPEDVPKFWVVCPCQKCERTSKPHFRLYSTVLMHLSQNLMGEKFKVLTSLNIRHTLLNVYYCWRT